MTFTLPIYYTVNRSTKKSTTHLVSDNWVRNLHYHMKNQVKQHYHTLVSEAIITAPTEPLDTFALHFQLYYKNPSSDPSNVIHQLEKYVLDALQDLGLITNDTVRHHCSSFWEVITQDKTNPRCVITLTPPTRQY
jgi:hypothetical protein